MAVVAFMTVEISDQDLVGRAQRGDRWAFSELVERYQDRIFSLCLRWLADPAAAEEVAQEAFLAAWRALPKFRGDARFDTWLRRIAVNKCKNHHDYRTRRGFGAHDSLHAESDRPALQLVDQAARTDGAVHRGQAERLLAEGLKRLNEEHRAILIYRDLEDLSYDEIASELGVARGTVKSRLHRARTALLGALRGRVGPEDVQG